MFFDQMILRGVLLILISVAAAQDIHRREISNWITIPLFVLGGIATLANANFFGLFLSLVILVGYLLPGGYGAADAKIIIGLIGLWPESVPLALLAAAGFDLFWRWRVLTNAPLVVGIWMGVILKSLF